MRKIPIKYCIKFLLLLLLVILNANVVFCEQNDSLQAKQVNIRYKNPEGREFWLCFEKNYEGNQQVQGELALELFITGDSLSHVRIEIKALGYVKEIEVHPGDVFNVKLNPDAQVLSNEKIDNLTVHIISDKPVTVYCLNKLHQSTDSFLALPKEVLGKEYRVICYTISEKTASQFAIVGVEDSSEIEILPTVNTIVNPAGIKFSIKLNRGEVYQVSAKFEDSKTCDLTGTYIKSNKPIAVFSGHQCAYIPSGIFACNHLIEQMPPIPSWGKQFYLGKLQPSQKYTYRVLANEPNTRVFVDNRLVDILQRGEFYEDNASRYIQITADKPILVAQFAQGSRAVDLIKDPEWGKKFIFNEIPLKSRSFTYQINAKEYDTKVFSDGKYLATINPGRPFENFANDTVTVTSNKPISVNINANIGRIQKYSVEQMWDTVFHLKPSESFMYRIFASEQNTKIYEGSKLLKILNSSEFYEDASSQKIIITSDKPIYAYQYAHGFGSGMGDMIGDPMMLLISPTQQFLQHYRFATPVSGSWRHYINIIIPTQAINTFRLNSSAINPNAFEPLGISRYSIAYLEIPYGAHTVKADEPFGMYSYGFGYGGNAFDAYGTMGGQSFIEYQKSADTLAPTIDIIQEADAQRIIVRDDRIDDSGIRDIVTLEAVGVEPIIPEIEAGALQVPIRVKLLEEDMNVGRIILQATDLANNTSLLTICCMFDEDKKEYYYTVSDGIDNECKPDYGLLLGAFGKFTGVFQSADFSSSGNISIPGKFSDANGTGGWGGIYIGKQINPQLIISTKISLENYGGTLKAPDSTVSHVRLESGEIADLRESSELYNDGSFFNLSAGVEWYFLKYLYLTGNINFTLTLSDAITLQRRILLPEGYTYANGSRVITSSNSPKNAGAFNTLRVGLSAGVGYLYSITYNLAAFAEAGFYYYPGSLISDGNWNINQLALLVGLKYRIKF